MTTHSRFDADTVRPHEAKAHALRLLPPVRSPSPELSPVSALAGASWVNGNTVSRIRSVLPPLIAIGASFKKATGAHKGSSSARVSPQRRGGRQTHPDRKSSRVLKGDRYVMGAANLARATGFEQGSIVTRPCSVAIKERQRVTCRPRTESSRKYRMVTAVARRGQHAQSGRAAHPGQHLRQPHVFLARVFGERVAAQLPPVFVSRLSPLLRAVSSGRGF